MNEKKYIQSIQRASKILDYLADQGSAKLNDICAETGLKTSTAFGIIQTLEFEGMITRIENGLEYTLGLTSLKYGLSYLNNSHLNKIIRIILEKLVDQIDETVYFALKIGDRFYYLDYLLSSQPLKVIPEEGRFIDLAKNTALAKAFNLKDEELGYALDLEEVYVGMNCLGIPFRNSQKNIGCIAFSGPSSRFTKEKMIEAFSIYKEVMKELGLEKHL